MELMASNTATCITASGRVKKTVGCVAPGVDSVVNSFRFHSMTVSLDCARSSPVEASNANTAMQEVVRPMVRSSRNETRQSPSLS
jgi:hypothetical protein